MRPGPPRGATATLEVTVRPDATETAEPAVYGMTQLSADVAELGRSLLDGHLEEGEGAVGTRLELLQRAPVPVGEVVSLTATVASVAPTALTAEVLARHRGTIVARGSYEIRVVRRTAFEAEVAARAGG
ncbi:MAG: thioesterase family protein [Nitriliruptoraceae bacterium]